MGANLTQDGSLHDLRLQQLEAWQSGQRLLVEDLVRRETVSDPESLLDLIYSEIVLREEVGERPTFDEYRRRFPAHAESLRRQFAVHEGLATPEDFAEQDHVEALPRETGTPKRADTLLVAPTLSLPGSGLSAPAKETSHTDIAGYEIVRELGRGGMGVVYEGRHRLLQDRVAAIKIIRSGDYSSGAERERFIEEARAGARLNHAHIVPLYEFGTFKSNELREEIPYFALEYLSGGSLAQKLNGTPLPPRDAAELLQRLAGAMHYAHAEGILHRDLKPANILLTADGQPKITDFGLAKRLDSGQGQTATGAIMGTPSYMPPEQASGKTAEIKAPADIYALGAILYECLTGRPPFKSDTVLNTLQQVATQDPVPPRTLNADVPADLETICLKCLQKEPRKRYGSAGDLAEDLRRFLAGEPIAARPASLAERAVKWVRRHPTTAALLTVSVLAVVGLLAAWGTFTAQLQAEKRHALEERARADEQRAHADEQRRRAETLEAKAKRERDRAEEQRKLTAEMLKTTVAWVGDQARIISSGKFRDAEMKIPGGVLYDLACAYAREAKSLRENPSLNEEQKQQLSDQYLNSAVQLLSDAKKLGFFGQEGIREKLRSRDLDLLRQRKEFKELTADLK